ncbi:hypothetical protein EMCRGX_G018076 [Ephydatia muelleri]
MGHLQTVCLKKRRGAQPVRVVSKKHSICTVKIVNSIPQLQQPGSKYFIFEVDTGAGDNFCSKDIWTELGKLALGKAHGHYEVANGQTLPTLGAFKTSVKLEGVKDSRECPLGFIVTETPNLNLLGRDAIVRSEVQARCAAKSRLVPFAIQDELNQAYDVGIAKGVWKPVQFNAHGTPVVPIRKPGHSNQSKTKIRVCGDYSVTVNTQLEPHRHPLPIPEDLIRKLGGGYGFTKVDLADAFNQIKLGPESQKRLALKIMDQLTSDLNGVATFIDDILVSGMTASEHLQNLRALLQRLQERGLRCWLEKCSFAQPSIEYLGYTLSNHGIAKGPKVNAIRMMPPPTDSAGLRSFLGSVQFYSKFLPDLATVTEPLHNLTRKNVKWKWGAEEQSA